MEFFLCYVLSYCFCDDNGQDGDANLKEKSDNGLVFTKFILFMTRENKRKTFIITEEKESGEEDNTYNIRPSPKRKD